MFYRKFKNKNTKFSKLKYWDIFSFKILNEYKCVFKRKKQIMNTLNMYLFHTVAIPYLTITFKVNAVFAVINTDFPTHED